MTNYSGLVSESCHENTFKLIRHRNCMMFYFQSGQLGHSTNTIIILKSNEHKSYAWVFSVICTFQSSKFLERLSIHSGVVYHIRASALTPQLIAVRHLGIELLIVHMRHLSGMG
jgi:hypothetical protein